MYTSEGKSTFLVDKIVPGKNCLEIGKCCTHTVVSHVSKVVNVVTVGIAGYSWRCCTKFMFSINILEITSAHDFYFIDWVHFLCCTLGAREIKINENIVHVVLLQWKGQPQTITKSTNAQREYMR